MPRFFSERLPFNDSEERVSVWRHLKIAFAHQESLRGPHGGYLTGGNGDWSDFSAIFLEMDESMLVAGQLAYAYPRLAQLAELRGDRAFAAKLRARAAELHRTVRREWTGRGWYSRGYTAAGTQIGSGAIFGEPQPWAILSGAPGRERARRLVGNIRRFLTGIGAPAAIGGPARIGSAQSPPRPIRRSPRLPTYVGFDGASQYVGGVWYDVNGWLTWALASLDGTVPGAARFAWSEYTRNTLAAHASTFPRTGTGRSRSTTPATPSTRADPARCGVGLYSDYAGQITEQPTWMVMGADQPRRRHRHAAGLPHRPAPAALLAADAAGGRGAIAAADARLPAGRGRGPASPSGRRRAAGRRPGAGPGERPPR